MKNGLFFHHAVYGKTHTSDEYIGHGHQINNTIVDSFSRGLPFFGFQDCAAHGALGLGRVGTQNYKE